MEEMAYTKEEKSLIIDKICSEIESGTSVRASIINNKISSATFYSWINGDEEKLKQYARACEERADAIADEILEIADSSEGDLYVDDNGDTKIDGNTVQRARLQVDTRKWLLGKLQPKKYGDRIQVAGDEESPLHVKHGFVSEKQAEEFKEFTKKKYGFKD